MTKLTETNVKNIAAPTKGQAFKWCPVDKGFGVRTTANGVKSWIVQVRVNGNETRRTLGRVGTMTLTEATALARLAINAAEKGDDVAATLGKSAAQTFTLQQAWDAYAAAGFPVQGSAAKAGKCKAANTVRGDASNWKLHLSKLANKPVAQITDNVVQCWCDGIVQQSGIGSRNQALLLLRATISFATSRGLCLAAVITVKAGNSKRVQNYLAPAELKAVDAALVELANEQPEHATGYHVVRVLLHTGCRKSEVLGLRRDLADLDNKLVRLAHDKANGDEGRTVLLSNKAVEILRSLPIIGRSEFFFPGRADGQHLSECDRHFKAALVRAGVKHVRLHDLRHSFASAAISGGVELHTVGKLLGHRDYKSTLRYAHLSDTAMRAGADKVAGLLG